MIFLYDVFSITLDCYSSLLLKPGNQQTASATSYSSEGLGFNEDFVPGDFAVINQDIFKKDSSSKEFKLIHNIAGTLRTKNALWRYDYSANTRDATAISMVREKRIIFKTETANIHVVNPFYFRKGGVVPVIIHSADLLKRQVK